jgi:hypothetical protein
LCLSLLERMTVMVPAPVVQNNRIRAMSGARPFAQGTPSGTAVKLFSVVEKRAKGAERRGKGAHCGGHKTTCLSGKRSGDVASVMLESPAPPSC